MCLRHTHCCIFSVAITVVLSILYNPLTALSFDFRVEGNHYVSDGIHQCSACAVKLSAVDRLTDTFKCSINSAEQTGSGKKLGRVKGMNIVRRNGRCRFLYFTLLPSVITIQIWNYTNSLK